MMQIYNLIRGWVEVDRARAIDFVNFMLYHMQFLEKEKQYEAINKRLRGVRVEELLEK